MAEFGSSTGDYFSLAGLALSAFGTVTSAQAQLQQGAVQNQIAQYNANVMQQRAQQVRELAAAKEAMQRRINGRQQGQIVAAYGASGVDVGQGTPLEVLHDAATEGELQAQLIHYGGEVDANNLMTQSYLDIASGQAASSAAQTGAMSTLLTGGARVSMGAYNLFGGAGKIPKTTSPDVGTGTGYTY